jgi:hypothetical protein
MFKRGAFELGATVCPIAIKYNKIFVDGFWNSRKQSFTQHLLKLMSSWAVVCDVYFLEPQAGRTWGRRGGRRGQGGGALGEGREGGGQQIGSTHSHTHMLVDADQRTLPAQLPHTPDCVRFACRCGSRTRRLTSSGREYSS